MSSSKSLIEFTSSILSDLAAAFGIPPGTTASLIREYLNKRAEVGRDILFDQIGKGEISKIYAASEDESIAIIYRYGLAIREGAARRNLKLLALVIVGLARRDCLYADEFNKYAEMLARLSRDEILVIGTLHRHRTKAERNRGRSISTHEWWPKAVEELVPLQFSSEEHVVAICCSAMRSGLVLTPRDFDSSGEFATSPIMDEVAELVDIEEALKDDGTTF